MSEGICNFCDLFISSEVIRKLRKMTLFTTACVEKGLWYKSLRSPHVFPCMCMYDFCWSYGNMIWRVQTWRWLLQMLKAALCDNLRYYTLKASVFSSMIVLVSFTSKTLFVFVLSDLGVLYENNRWFRIYERTCYFSNNTSPIWGKKDCLNRSDIFPETSFCNAVHPISVTMILL